MDQRNTPKGRRLLNLSRPMLADSLSDDRLPDDRSKRTGPAGSTAGKRGDKLAGNWRRPLDSVAWSIRFAGRALDVHGWETASAFAAQVEGFPDRGEW
jgi:hypothetical protein